MQVVEVNVCCSVQSRLLAMCCWRKLSIIWAALQWTLWLSILHWWVELLHAAVISQYHNTSAVNNATVFTAHVNTRTYVQCQ